MVVSPYLKDDVLVAIAVGATKRIAVVGGRSSIENHRLVAGEGDMLLYFTPLGGGIEKSNGKARRQHNGTSKCFGVFQISKTVSYIQKWGFSKALIIQKKIIIFCFVLFLLIRGHNGFG